MRRSERGQCLGRKEYVHITHVHTCMAGCVRGGSSAVGSVHPEGLAFPQHSIKVGERLVCLRALKAGEVAKQ